MRGLIVRLAKAIKGNDYTLDDNIPIQYLISVAFERCCMLIRGFFCKIGMKRTEKHFFVGRKVKLRCRGKMIIGASSTLQDGVYIDALSIDGFKLGKGCSIGRGTIIRCSGNYKQLGIGFSMGDNSSLADNCFVGATGGVSIGNDVIGGQNIRFHSSNHVFSDLNELICKQGITAKGIVVGDNCWIGAGVIFCDGVEVGAGCVIGANSVVTKSFPNNCVIAGNPAKIIRYRGV